jgi:hypothetical protein
MRVVVSYIQGFFEKSNLYLEKRCKEIALRKGRL